MLKTKELIKIEPGKSGLFPPKTTRETAKINNSSCPNPAESRWTRVRISSLQSPLFVHETNPYGANEGGAFLAGAGSYDREEAVHLSKHSKNFANETAASYVKIFQLGMGISDSVMRAFRCSLLCICTYGLRAQQSDGTHLIRATGAIRATHSLFVQVPVMQGQGGQLTLIKLVQNGALVHAGDLLAEFDDTAQIKAAREAAAKYDDLSHQVEQKRAEHASDREKRLSALQTAQADLGKAEIDLKKGPVLSEIEQQKDAIKVSDAKEHVASLQRSNKAHETAESAEIRVLELQRDRQKVAVARQQTNASRLAVRAPIDGMIALQNVWRSGSMGHAEEGDQLYAGGALLQLFDPSAMQVAVSVGEPDGAILKPGTRALVHLDAFPNVVLAAHFDSASPVATSSMDNPIKSFNARFVLEQSDSHLMPDLSAAVEIREKP